MSTFYGQIKPLTSVRFFAAFFVLLSHLDYFQNTNLSFMYVKEGFVGVTLFFILSGFILAYSYQERIIQKRTSAIKFYFARIARIYPLHIVTLILALPFFIMVGQPDMLKFVSNLFLFQAFIPSTEYYFSLNAPSWSISVEFFLYLIFPFIIKLKSKSLLIITVCIILVKLFIPFESEKLKHAFLYISPLLRIADFSIGILIYRYRSSLFIDNKSSVVNSLQFISMFILFIFIVLSGFVDVSYRFDIYYIIPMGFLIFSLSFGNGFIGWLLSNKVIVFLGEASFSLYMTHQLIIKYMISINKKFNILSDASLLMIIITLSIIASIVFYKLIELPMKKWTYDKLLSLRFNKTSTC